MKTPETAESRRANYQFSLNIHLLQNVSAENLALFFSEISLSRIKRKDFVDHS